MKPKPSRRRLIFFLGGASAVSLLCVVTSLLQDADPRPLQEHSKASNGSALGSAPKTRPASLPHVHGQKRPRDRDLETSHEPSSPGLLGEDGRIIPAVARQWDLSEDQVLQCRDALRSVQKEVQAYVLTTLKKDQAQDDSDGNGVGYRAAVDPTLPARLEAMLLREIGGIAGSEVAAALAGEVLGKDDYLCLGRSDLVIRLYPASSPGAEAEVAYEFRDPVTDEYQGGGRGELKVIEPILGGLDLRLLQSR